MTWTYDSTTRTWTKSDTGRETLMVDADLPGACAVRLELFNINKPVRFVCFASPDGRSCVEVGVNGANLEVRILEFGVVTSTPESEAHGLAANVPYTIEIHRRAGVLEVFLDGVSTITWTVAGVPEGRERYGFSAQNDGSRVARAVVCGLKPLRATRRDALVIVVNGTISLYDEGSLRAVAPNAFDPQADVWAVVFRQKVYAGDGRVAKIIDPNNAGSPVVPYAPTAGFLPGQESAEDRAAGVCSATVAAFFYDRIAFAGDPNDEQNILFTALGDPLDLDTGAQKTDRAYGASTDRSRVGEPVRALVQAANGVLVIGCTGSIWRMTGDPSIGVPEVVRVWSGSGISGSEAVGQVQDGVVAAHTPEGIVLVPAIGEPVPLSNPTVTSGLNMTPAEAADRHVILRRDPERQAFMVFLTPRASGPAVHLWYDERTGGWSPGRGGFFPVTVADAAGPTAAAVVGGRLVIGTRTGYLLVMDDEATTDDGSPIELLCSTLIDLGHGMHDTILSRLLIVLAQSGDDVQYRVFGGRTAEEAFLGDERWLLLAGRSQQRYRLVSRPVRAPALVLELSHAEEGGRADVETVEIGASVGRLSTRRPRSPFAAAALCPPPGAPVGSGSGGGSGFSSGGGGGGSDTPGGECETITVLVGGTTEYDFGEDSTVAITFRGLCFSGNPPQKVGEATETIVFENPSLVSGACRWTHGDSWVRFTDSGTWEYSISAADAATYDPSCGGGETTYLTQAHDDAPSFGVYWMKERDEADPDGTDQCMDGVVDGPWKVADALLDNGCAEEPEVEATGFKKWVAYCQVIE
ncbi:MAG TPA: hypothetical protein PLU35_14540 [Phycisphaerales bacterium]|nr:hypothetical protein [Phycisphaerales bacterium]